MSHRVPVPTRLLSYAFRMVLTWVGFRMRRLFGSLATSQLCTPAHMDHQIVSTRSWRHLDCCRNLVQPHQTEDRSDSTSMETEFASQISFPSPASTACAALYST